MNLAAHPQTVQDHIPLVPADRNRLRLVSFHQPPTRISIHSLSPTRTARAPVHAGLTDRFVEVHGGKDEVGVSDGVNERTSSEADKRERDNRVRRECGAGSAPGFLVVPDRVGPVPGGRAGPEPGIRSLGRTRLDRLATRTQLGTTLADSGNLAQPTQQLISIFTHASHDSHDQHSIYSSSL